MKFFNLEQTREYIESLQNQTVIVLCGLPNSGKSTLYKGLDFSLYSYDDYRLEVYKNSDEKFKDCDLSEINYNLAFKYCVDNNINAVEKTLFKLSNDLRDEVCKQVIIVDGTHTSKKSRISVINQINQGLNRNKSKTLEQKQFDLVLINIMRDPNDCANNQNRTNKYIPAHVYSSMVNGWTSILKPDYINKYIKNIECINLVQDF